MLCVFKSLYLGWILFLYTKFLRRAHPSRLTNKNLYTSHFENSSRWFLPHTHQNVRPKRFITFLRVIDIPKFSASNIIIFLVCEVCLDYYLLRIREFIEHLPCEEKKITTTEILVGEKNSNKKSCAYLNRTQNALYGGFFLSDIFVYTWLFQVPREGRRKTAVCIQ